MSQTLYLRCAPGDVAERVLLTGDPARVERIGAAMDNARKIAHSREFLTMTGSWRGVPLSIISSGIGSPSAAIALEEMAQVGAKAVVRIGTTMGIRLPMGSLLLASGAARLEGTSTQYLPLAYPAVPDWRLMLALERAARATGRPVQVGLVATVDGFYTKMAPALAGHGLPELTEMRRGGVLSIDMETSVVLSVGRLLGMAAGSLCLVTNNADPFEIIENGEREHGEKQLIHAVMDALVDWKPTDD